MAATCCVEMEVQPGVTGERPGGVLLAANLCEPTNPAYEVVRIGEGERILGLSVYGHELAYCCAPNEVRIADIRRDHTNSHIQTLTRTGEDCIFGETQLTSSHVVGYCLDDGVKVFWGRATGECVREIDGFWYLEGLCGSHVLFSASRDDGEPVFGIWELDTPEEGPAFLSNQPATSSEEDTILLGDRELYHFHTTQTQRIWSQPFEAITVYSVDTRDVVRQISLSEPVPRFHWPWYCFSQGLVVMDENGPNH